MHCDNMTVVHIINNMSSSCKHCMKILRILTLDNLKMDQGVFTRHIQGKKNFLSDSLSRLEFDKFFKLALKEINQYPDNLDERLWPIEKVWNN